MLIILKVSCVLSEDPTPPSIIAMTSFPLENPQLLKPLAHADVVETPPRPASPEYRFGTRAVHSGAHIDPNTGAVIAPVSSLSPLEMEDLLI
jgi:hypothetical protein